jgi:hypothetical protein
MSCYYVSCSEAAINDVVIEDDNVGAVSVCDTHYAHLDALVDFVDA